MNKSLIDALGWITQILDSRKITYQITGGLAAHIYGSNREINDIDIDIPEDSFDILYPEVQSYSIFGPAQYTDSKWDLKLITLNYHGQEIDIGGAYETKIFDDSLNKWVSCKADFSKRRQVKFHGIDVYVVDPENLIEYKSLLDGSHQKEDISAVRNFLQY